MSEANYITISLPWRAARLVRDKEPAALKSGFVI